MSSVAGGNAMNPFEFVFALFGLLLGLCIAEVFGGLGRSFERRGELALGWLTPLLGVLVLTDLTNWWSTLWEERNAIPMNPLTLILGTIFAGSYYLAAYIVFPRELSSKVNLDDHFYKIRRLVVEISAAAFLCVLIVEFAVTRKINPIDFAGKLILFGPVYMVALYAKRKRLAGGAVALLIGLNLVGAVTHVLSPPTP
jgi:hypothetical protein